MLEKLKKIFNKEENDKKRVENLVILIIIIIITVVAINYIWNGDKKEEKNTTETKKLAVSSEKEGNTNNDLEKRLENILSKIDGVGEVKVLITYSETSKLIPLYDEDSTQTTTEETDSNGGKRVTNENSSKKDVIYGENVEGGKNPITQSVVNAKIEGAIIAAEGAKNADVKANVIQAVEAVTGLATHKIQVFEINKGGQ